MTTVTYTFDPYNHSAVQKLIRNVTTEFGNDKSRWYWRPQNVLDFESPNVWPVNFYFRDSIDATLFSLKFIV